MVLPHFKSRPSSGRSDYCINSIIQLAEAKSTHFDENALRPDNIELAVDDDAREIGSARGQGAWSSNDRWHRSTPKRRASQ